MPREKGTKPIPLQIRTATPTSLRLTWRVYGQALFTIEKFEAMLEAVKGGNARTLGSFRETARYLSLGISNRPRDGEAHETSRPR